MSVCVYTDSFSISKFTNRSLKWYKGFLCEILTLTHRIQSTSKACFETGKTSGVMKTE